MTIDHTNCGHERTPKDRAACRKRRAAVTAAPTPLVRASAEERSASTFLTTKKAPQIAVTAPKAGTFIPLPDDTHCSSCGELADEDNHDGDGYSLCCNKRRCFGDGQVTTYNYGRMPHGTPPAGKVTACCVGVAEIKARNIGGGYVVL